MTDRLGRFEPAAYERLRAIADSVMREGQVLYPYRASAAKNSYRWIFGVAVPPSYAERTGEVAELAGAVPLSRPLHADAAVSVVVRFLQPHEVELVDETGTSAARIDVDGDLHVAFDGTRLVEMPVELTTAQATATAEHRTEGVEVSSSIVDRSGRVRGTLVERMRPLQVDVAVEVTDAAVRVGLHNTTSGTFSQRDDATRSSPCGVHALVQVDNGSFASSAQSSAASQPRGLWPSLAGPPGSCRHALLTPMVLPDHAHIAAESAGEWFDGLEIEEMLSLRMQTLAPGELREVAATDPWAAQALARAGAMDAGDLSRLHGAQRSVTEVGRGDAVVLEPGPRTDTMDAALAGRRATVRDIRPDQDGRVFIGVTVDDDPATDLHLIHGRLFWFLEHEVRRV